ncbi:MAG: hypothetical protein KC593_15320 [Myxococcales bacterium]|nr:hypothetical protein [Myxococcales bacterium]MCB9626912.1 hypothetical protein [Sandaracinaceae bacterium]
MPSILNTVRDLERLRQIVSVLARHGFGEVVQRTGLGSLLPGTAKHGGDPTKVGERVRLVLQDLGPSFIKLGQIVSTRPDLIPEDVIFELKKLQDNVPPAPFEDIRAEIEAELGRELCEVYASFSETPLATASIGQVHRATLASDAGPLEVVVKVQRKGCKDIIERDVDLLYWLARAIERSIPEARLYHPVRLVEEFDRSIMSELDYVLEADNCDVFRRNFEGNRGVVFPRVYRECSSKRVLTLSYLDGHKIYDAIKNGMSGETIARRAIQVIVQQVFEDGFFHADPHPGNIIMMGELDAPVFGMVDLGMVGRLSPQMRDKTIDLMIAAVREDYRGIADALLAIGRPTKKIDRQAYEAEVAFLAQKYLGKKLGDIEFSGLIRDLVGGARKYSIEMPADFLMLGKSLMTVEGVGKEIYPDLDLLEEARPYFLTLIKQRYAPERMTQDLMRGAMRLSTAATEVPLQVQEILEDLRNGAFRLRVSDDDAANTADKLGRRLFSGIVVGSLFVSSAILIAADQWWPGGVAASLAVAYGTAHAALVFILKRFERLQKNAGG